LFLVYPSVDETDNENGEETIEKSVPDKDKQPVQQIGIKENFIPKLRLILY
jgi:hypothetical protein